MIEAKDLKRQLNNNQMITLVESLGGELISENSEYCIFTSICHNIDASDTIHKPKLYGYKTNMGMQFHCYVCGFHSDIFGLIEERWDLLEVDYTFKDVINYVLSTLHIDGAVEFTHKKKMNWRDDMRKLMCKFKTSKSYKLFPVNDIDLFDDRYPLSWIDEGISVDTMSKYNIGYYGRLDCTTIPVYDYDNHLCGIQMRLWNPDMIELYGKYHPLHTLNKDYAFPTSEMLYGIHLNKNNIKKTGKVFIFEGVKSVLLAEEYFDTNNAVAIFGVNMSKSQRDILISNGAEEFVICLDKEYDKIYDYNDDSDGYKEYKKWEKNIKKIIKLLKPFGRVSVICDKNNLIDKKDSPIDKGRDVFYQLYKERVVV